MMTIKKITANLILLGLSSISFPVLSEPLMQHSGFYSSNATNNIHTIPLEKISINNASLQSAIDLDMLDLSSLPEPDTFAMLLSCISLMGFVAHRRHKA